MDLTIVIPTHNRCKVLEKSLQNLSHRNPKGFPILVFADACTDGTQVMIRSKFPEIRLVESVHRLGVAGSRNAAFAECTTEWIFSLDDDSWPLNDRFDEAALDAVWSNQDIAFLSGNIHDSNYPQGLSCLGDRPHRVRNFAGCGFFVRKRVFESLGGFCVLAYYGNEESEICLRAYLEGFEVYYVPALEIWHERSKWGRDDLQEFRSGFGNSLSFSLLHEPLWLVPLHWGRLSWRGYRFAYRSRIFPAFWGGWLDFICRCPQLCRKRRAVPLDRLKGWYSLSPRPPVA